MHLLHWLAEPLKDQASARYNQRTNRNLATIWIFAHSFEHDHASA